MCDLEECLIYSWIKFNSIKLKINISSEDEKNQISIDKDTDPKEFMKIKFLCLFAQNKLDFTSIYKKNKLNYEENNLPENKNNQIKFDKSLNTPEDICEFFKKFENFCVNFFSYQLDTPISNEMKSLFKNYTSKNKVIYKTETKKNLLLFYKIIFFIRFIQDLLININTNQINFMDILEKFSNEKKDFFKITMKDPYLFNILIKIINSVIIFSTKSINEKNITSFEFIDNKFTDIYEELKKDRLKILSKRTDERITEKIFTFKKEDFNQNESIICSFSKILSKKVQTNSLKNSSIIKVFDTQIKKEIMNLRQESIIDEEDFIIETDRTQKVDKVIFSNPKQIIDLESFYGRKKSNKVSIKDNKSGSESSLNNSFRKSLFSKNSSSDEENPRKIVSNMSKFNNPLSKEEDEHIILRENLAKRKQTHDSNKEKSIKKESSIIYNKPFFGEIKENILSNNSSNGSSEYYSKCSIDDSMFEKDLDSKLNFIEKNSDNENVIKRLSQGKNEFKNDNDNSIFESININNNSNYCSNKNKNHDSINTLEVKLGDNHYEKRLKVNDTNSFNNYTNNFITYNSINLEKEVEETPKNLNYLLDKIVELRKEVENSRSEINRLITSLRSLKYENVTLRNKLKVMERKNDDYRNFINNKDKIISKTNKENKINKNKDTVNKDTVISLDKLNINFLSVKNKIQNKNEINLNSNLNDESSANNYIIDNNLPSEFILNDKLSSEDIIKSTEKSDIKLSIISQKLSINGIRTLRLKILNEKSKSEFDKSFELILNENESIDLSNNFNFEKIIEFKKMNKEQNYIFNNNNNENVNISCINKRVNNISSGELFESPKSASNDYFSVKNHIDKKSIIQRKRNSKVPNNSFMFNGTTINNFEIDNCFNFEIIGYIYKNDESKKNKFVSIILDILKIDINSLDGIEIFKENSIYFITKNFRKIAQVKIEFNQKDDIRKLFP